MLGSCNSGFFGAEYTEINRRAIKQLGYKCIRGRYPHWHCYYYLVEPNTASDLARICATDMARRAMAFYSTKFDRGGRINTILVFEPA